MMEKIPDQGLKPTAAPPASSGELVLDYPGKVRVIRQSNRCLWAGILSAVAFGLFARSLYLFVRASTATGEPWRWLPLVLFQWGTCIVAVAIVWQIEFESSWHWSVLLFLGAQAGQAFWIYWRYKTARPTHWNPARVQLYWGIALGHAAALILYLGLTVALSVLVVRLVSVFQR